MIRPVYRVSLHTRVKNLLEISKGRETKRDRDCKTVGRCSWTPG
jgi:hypothetical protein